MVKWFLSTISVVPSGHESINHEKAKSTRSNVKSKASATIFTHHWSTDHPFACLRWPSCPGPTTASWGARPRTRPWPSRWPGPSGSTWPCPRRPPARRQRRGGQRRTRVHQTGPDPTKTSGAVMENGFFLKVDFRRTNQLSEMTRLQNDQLMTWRSKTNSCSRRLYRQIWEHLAIELEIFALSWIKHLIC